MPINLPQRALSAVLAYTVRYVALWNFLLCLCINFTKRIVFACSIGLVIGIVEEEMRPTVGCTCMVE